ncbi:MAG: glycosyltransferase family 2 protein [Candidatus Omnitrophica bacterium]|nr:glycosyltransferase family 2 protein [Candidatus Omnitrophota bacterium]
MKLSVIITCFNEKATILAAIEEARQLDIDKEIIVIDNCSSDGTKQILEGLGDKTLQIVFQPKNFGVGQSVKLGVEMATGDCCYSPCADLEYRMNDVFKMIKKMEQNNLDAVFGSRIADRKNISKLVIIKERPYYAATIVATYLINKWYGRNFTDIIAPKLIKADIFKKLAISSNGQAFEFELVSRLCEVGCRIAEVPIYYKPRSAKQGKTIKPWDFIPALLAMIKVRLSRKNKS